MAIRPPHVNFFSSFFKSTQMTSRKKSTYNISPLFMSALDQPSRVLKILNELVLQKNCLLKLKRWGEKDLGFVKVRKFLGDPSRRSQRRSSVSHVLHLRRSLSLRENGKKQTCDFHPGKKVWTFTTSLSCSGTIACGGWRSMLAATPAPISGANDMGRCCWSTWITVVLRFIPSAARCFTFG